ncbi:MAG: LUD domain-containing protein [Bryobacteraceae bacterium]|nr:LUD domain-containing protein [Bryobacteraceae bacterium]
MSSAFKESIDKAVHDSNLTGALGRFSESYRSSRAKAYEGVDFEAVRTQIAGIKGGAASHLDELAAEFKKNAEAHGAKVFRASNPEQVKDYILKLAKANGVEFIVKSKSMASEEIHLNKHLEAQGIQVSETDLGEWIIQLVGQRPSHMVMPAIHLTKEEVAEIFSKEVNERLSSDIPRLVKVARRELRERFLKAGMGISGANIAVAETGTLVIVTNEGNARLVTTLPKIHVAIVGLEKLVPHFSDIVPILTALPRGATCQLLTSYVTMITGPSPNTDGSLKDLHIILMDSHRTEMAGDDKFRQALQCIRCGSCLNVCPVYRLTGGHVFGKVYMGGIGTILTAWFDALKESEDIQSLCIQCGNCKEVCPGKIDIPDLILELRRRLVKDQGQSLKEKSIFAVVNNRRAFHAMLRSASLLQKPFEKDGFIRHLPLFLSGMADFRSLPTIAGEPFRDLVGRTSRSARGLQAPQASSGQTSERALESPRGSGEPPHKAAFYAGCLIDFAYPEMGQAVVKVLNKAGIEVIFPEEQTCCGAPARYSGAYEVAAKNAVDNINALLKQDVRWVVSACPTCTVALKHEFSATLESVGRKDQLPRAAELAAKVVDFSSLVKSLVDEGRLKLKPGMDLGKITYHDSCHMKRTLHVDRQPRELLQLAGYELVEMKESDTCCGMGGSYSLKMPEISAPILKRKLENIEATGAPLTAVDCPGCAMQIRGGLDKKHSPIRVRHTAELVAEMVE